MNEYALCVSPPANYAALDANRPVIVPVLAKLLILLSTRLFAECLSQLLLVKQQGHQLQRNWLICKSVFTNSKLQ